MITTAELNDLMRQTDVLGFEDLLFLQGEMTTPAGNDVDVTISEVFPETSEVMFSIPENGGRRKGSLGLGAMRDVFWYPEPHLAARIDIARHAVANDRNEVDPRELRLRLDAERDQAACRRDAERHLGAMNAALIHALALEDNPDAGRPNWSLVLMGMAAHREKICLRDERESQFLEDRIGAAECYGNALRTSPRQAAWQMDILRRSANTLGSILRH